MKPMMQRVTFLTAGLVFGFILSRVGATDYDAIAGMFQLTDLHLMGVIGVAVVVIAVGQALLRRVRPTMNALTPKPRKPGNAVGGLIFGAGWALTGACPGTVLSQVGEGQILALATLTGILGGAYLHRKVGARVEGALNRTPKFELSGPKTPSAEPATAQ